MALDLLKIDMTGDLVISPEAIAIPCFNRVYTTHGYKYLSYIHFLMSKKVNNHYADLPYDERKKELIIDLELDATIVEFDAGVKECIDMYIKHDYTVFHRQLETIQSNVLPKIEAFLNETDILTIKDVLDSSKMMSQLPDVMNSIAKFKDAIVANDRQVETTVRGGGALSAMERIAEKEKKSKFKINGSR